MLVLALINCLVKYPMVCCCSHCCGCCCSCCCCFCCCAAKSLRTFKSHLQRNQLRNWDQIYHNLGRFWKVAKISKKRRVISIYSINSCWSCPSLVCPRPGTERPCWYYSCLLLLTSDNYIYQWCIFCFFDPI